MSWYKIRCVNKLTGKQISHGYAYVEDPETPYGEAQKMFPDIGRDQRIEIEPSDLTCEACRYGEPGQKYHMVPGGCLYDPENN